MTTIKSYTDISQSKKLAKILPIESSDMYWDLLSKSNYAKVNDIGYCLCRTCVYAWSLAALLNIIGHYTLQTVSDSKRVIVVSENGNPISSFSNPQPVDACYELILKLHELNLL